MIMTGHSAWVRANALLLLLLLALSAAASPSNKWRLQFSGGADSDGTIVLKLTPEGGEAIATEIFISDGTGENAVAKAVVKGLKARLPGDIYHVERDDGEDVLIKRHHGEKNFDVEIISNAVRGVRINPDRE
ncbi:MAG: hypothetical protein PVJ33_15005 [Lysobacterales bacterium]|jgi:hypothetical protein